MPARRRAAAREGLSLRDYAEHRKARGLVGQSNVAVWKAIRNGRLTPPAIRRVGKNWAIDPAVADLQWAENTDQAQQRDAAATAASNARGAEQRQLFPTPASEKTPPQAASTLGETIARARAAKETLLAKLAQVRLNEKTGELVRRADVEKEVFELARKVRDSVLSCAPRLGPVLAAMVDPVEVEDRLRLELTQALEELTRDGRGS